MQWHYTSKQFERSRLHMLCSVAMEILLINIFLYRWSSYRYCTEGL
uniref:Uncharacterized protein n=1 Tax=Anguilla anguilla TaxID=7936 RepID=A0A0E9RYZ9_ANGAN